MKQNGETYGFWLQALPFKWFLISFLIPTLCFGQVQTQVNPTYLCTSRQYQMSFGSSQQCPNIEEKTHHGLLGYLRWLYGKDVPGLPVGRRATRKEIARYRKEIAETNLEARDAYVTFKCEWREL